MSKQDSNSKTIDIPTYVPVTSTARFTRKAPSKIISNFAGTNVENYNENSRKEYKLNQEQSRKEISPSLTQTLAIQKSNADLSQPNKEILTNMPSEITSGVTSGIMGMVGNIFMGSTSKYFKAQVNNNISTPIKEIKEIDSIQSSDTNVIKSNSPPIQPRPTYTKYFQHKSNNEVNKAPDIKLEINSNSKIDNANNRASTDRSNKEGAKKIDKKQPQQIADINLREKVETVNGVVEQKRNQINVIQQVNKLQSTYNQIIKTNSSNNFNDFQKKNGKKPLCILLIIRRVIKEKLLDAFKMIQILKINTPFQNANEIALLNVGIFQIIKHKQINLLKCGFEALKQRFDILYFQKMKSGLLSTPLSYKRIAFVLLDRLFITKMRQPFARLKNRQQIISSKINILLILDSYLRNKNMSILTKNVSAIKDWLKNRKFMSDRLINNYQSMNKIIIFQSFNKLFFSAIANDKKGAVIKIEKQTSRTSLKYEVTQQLSSSANNIILEKLSQLKNKTAQIEEELRNLEDNINLKMSQKANQKKDLTQKLNLLKRQNEQISNDLSIKKQHNEDLKVQIQKFQPASNLSLGIDENSNYSHENEQTKLPFLENFYFNISIDAVAWRKIINTFDFKEGNVNNLLREWKAITLNLELKSQISNYENIECKHTKVRNDIYKQQALISKLMRSYVKERYCWEWIHLYSQNS